MPVAQGRALTVVAYDNEWAQVFNGSFYAFIPRAHIARASQTAQPTVAPTAAPEQGGEVVRETFSATVTAQGAYVYQTRSTSAAPHARGPGPRADRRGLRRYLGAGVQRLLLRLHPPRAHIARASQTAQPTVAPTVAPTAAPEQGGEVVRETFSAHRHRAGGLCLSVPLHQRFPHARGAGPRADRGRLRQRVGAGVQRLLLRLHPARAHRPRFPDGAAHRRPDRHARAHQRRGAGELHRHRHRAGRARLSISLHGRGQLQPQPTAAPSPWWPTTIPGRRSATARSSASRSGATSPPGIVSVATPTPHADAHAHAGRRFL